MTIFFCFLIKVLLGENKLLQLLLEVQLNKSYSIKNINLIC